jgi:hypothetical protein
MLKVGSNVVKGANEGIKILFGHWAPPLGDLHARYKTTEFTIIPGS